MNQVLLVEDEDIYRELLAEQIREMGVSVMEAQNGKVALDLLQKNNADLILLDLMMPVMDGKAFLEKFSKTSHKETPVIILTNLSHDHIPPGMPFIMKAETDLDKLLNIISEKLKERN